MEPTNGSFADRLRWVLGPRKATAWAKRLQIPAGTRDRMLRAGGIPPTYESLTKIMRTEHVSLNWLLGGEGAPFLLARTASDAETAELLRQHLQEEAWRVHLVIDEHCAALVLHQPAELGAGDASIRYQAIEILAGPVGPAAFDVLQALRYGRIDGVTRLEADEMADLYAGRIGTFALIGDEKFDGLIGPGIDRGVDVSAAIEDLGARHVADGGLEVPDPIQPLARWWPLLEPGEREALQTLLDPFLAHVASRHKGEAN